MAIRGSLTDASLSDVLQLLALGQKTGCLTIRDGGRFGYIYFDTGAISFASVVNSRDRLGDLLRTSGLVSAETLEEALHVQGDQSSRRLGEILVQRGAISRADLEPCIGHQVEEAIYELFTWKEGSFAFTPQQRPSENEILIRISAESVLLEGARRMDEWSVIEKKVPSLDLVLAPSGGLADGSASDLTAEQRRVVPWMDGDRSIREIAAQSRLSDFETAKAFAGLLGAGMAHEVGRKSEPERPGESSSEAERRRNLALALYRTRMLADAETELKELLRLAPGDVAGRFHLALVELRTGREMAAVRRLQALIEQRQAEGAGFHNIALALEGAGETGDALLALERAGTVLERSPAVLLSRAVLLTKTNRMREAAELFRAYRERMGERHRAPAVFFAFAMLAEAAAGGLEAARALAEEGVRHYPRASPVLLHAGAVHERTGDMEEAERLYRRAVEHDLCSARCRRALADSLYRREAWTEAAAEYERVLALDPTPPDEAVYRLANIRYKLGRRGEAVRLWRLALELNPDNALARTNLELVEKSRAS